jgi:hypothetical protein
MSKGEVIYNETKYEFKLKILKRNKRKMLMTINDRNIYTTYIGGGISTSNLNEFMKLVKDAKTCFDILDLIKNRVHQIDKDLDVFEIKKGYSTKYNNLYIDKLEKERKK